MGKDIIHTNDVDANNASHCPMLVSLRLTNMEATVAVVVVMIGASPVR